MIVLGAAVLLFGGAYVALLHAFPAQRLTTLLAEQVHTATGREFRIGGKLSLQLLPTIAVVAEDVAFGNAPWGSRKEMATVKRAAFEVAVSPLLRGELHVLSVDVDGADVLLETGERGQANWIFGEHDKPTAQAPSGTTPQVRLDRFSLSDSRIAFRVGLTKAAHALDIDALQVVSQGDRVALSARFAQQRSWRLEGTSGRYEALARGQADWPFDLRLVGDGARLAASGSLDPGGSLQAKVTVRVDNAAALAPWFDAAALPMPIEGNAELTRTATAVSADAVQLSVGGQSMSGKVTVHTRPAGPRIELSLAAPTIDLARWGIGQPAASASAPSPASHEPLFADTPLPTIALPGTPLRASVQIDRLTAPGVPALSALKAQIDIEPDRLLADPLSFTLAGGAVHARLELGVRRSDPLRAKLRGEATGLSVEAIDAMRGVGGHFRGGHLNASVNLEAAGRTPHALASSLSGTASVSVADTAMIGGAAAMERNLVVALLQALLPMQETEKSLRIECAVVHLPLRSGVARIDRSIAMETDKVAISASGEVNLAAQTVTLSFEPTPKKGLGLDSSNLAKLVMVEGPLQSPRIGVDMKGTAKEAANIGAAVATAGLTLVGKRLLAKPEDTQACKRAARAAAP